MTQDFRRVVLVTPGEDYIVAERIQAPYNMPSEKTGATRHEYAHFSRPSPCRRSSRPHLFRSAGLCRRDQAGRPRWRDATPTEATLRLDCRSSRGYRRYGLDRYVIALTDGRALAGWLDAERRDESGRW